MVTLELSNEVSAFYLNVRGYIVSPQPPIAAGSSNRFFIGLAMIPELSAQ
jgi:hypothetical protein